jgi:acetoin utilization deacetylase AcuC-like enzyme
MATIPVFYTPAMVADAQSISPSAAKPEKVVASWQRQFPIEIIAPAPVTVDDYARAHDRAFVDGVLSGRIANGFSNRSADVAAALPYTSGSMLAAATHALATGTVAAAPCSGFHHAEFSRAMGFCTFNGLMVTALALKERGLIRRLGILDLDMHYGNGTADIIRVRDCAGWIRHFTAGDRYTEAAQAGEFFAQLPLVLAEMSRCDLVLYQAGADPHLDDPFGGWLTTAQLAERDALVFATLAAAKIPVAWNLAGGYQVERDGSIPKVLEIHDNTMRECVRFFT